MRSHSSAALLGDDCCVMNNAQVSVGHHGLCVASFSCETTESGRWIHDDCHCKCTDVGDFLCMKKLSIGNKTEQAITTNKI